MKNRTVRGAPENLRLKSATSVITACRSGLFVAASSSAVKHRKRIVTGRRQTGQFIPLSQLC